MQNINIIPAPQVIIEGKNKTVKNLLEDKVSSVSIALDLTYKIHLNSMLYGFHFQTVKFNEFCDVYKQALRDDFDYEEGYALKIESKDIIIAADTPKSEFYAIQTLAQILAGTAGGYIPELTIIDWPSLKVRGFNLCYHLISENMPMLAPNYDMAVHLIELMAHFKMNTLLIEWESMFPFKKFAGLKNDITFTSEQIKTIKLLCEKYFIDIIPLVQSIGHAYYVLRHPEFAHLRELPDTTQQYCTNSHEAVSLVCELIDEILHEFPHTKYFHLGGDEARRLAQCPACSRKYKLEGMRKLYGDHINEIGKYLIRKGITPIVWSDIMEIHTDIIDELHKEIAIMYWNYDIPGVAGIRRPYAMELFKESKREIIGASAARFGACCDYMFPYKRSMRNIAIMALECKRNETKGTIVTDWMKLTPSETGIIAMSYAAQNAWRIQGSQREYCEKFAGIYFGADIKEMDDIFSLVSETVPLPENMSCREGVLPYCRCVEADADFLDRFDMSAKNFVVRLIDNAAQGQRNESIKMMEKGLERSDAALEIISKYKKSILFNKRVFDIIELAALTQRFKCRMGLALDRAIILLKYPRPNEKNERLSLANELDELCGEWKNLKNTTYELLLPGTFEKALINAIEFKFDGDELLYMKNYSNMLRAGKHMQGLVNFKAYQSSARGGG